MADSSMAQILGRIPSGIFILTVAHEGRETGMLASWVMQAGFDPPMVTVAVNKERYLAEWLDAGAPFVLNVVGEDQKHLLAHFGRGFEPDVPAFEGVDVGRCPRGVPVLPDVVGYLECQSAGYVDSGDHRVFLARVLDGRLATKKSPMVHVRNSGLHY